MSFLARAIVRLSHVRRIEFLLAAGAVLVSLVYIYFFYFRLSEQLALQLDPEAYGSLGTSLWKNGILAYFPDTTPTVFRGPTYPLLVAAVLAITDGWYPHAIQILHALLAGVTALAVFAAAERLWSRPVATVAALVCMLHPLIIGWTGKIVLEPLVTALFTLLVASTLRLAERPTYPLAMAVGALLGALALAKGTYLPFVLVIPIYLLWMRDRRFSAGHVAALTMVAVVMLGVWTVRNGNVSGKYSPSQALTGYNLRRGDMNLDQLRKPPFAGDHFWKLSVEEIDTMGGWFRERWQADWYRDSVLMTASLARYREEPGFLATKIAMNTLLFWILGDTPVKTAFYALLQLPLVVLFAISARRRLRTAGVRSIEGLHIALVLLYYLAHLPIFAFFRLSSVLIPVMVIYAAGLLGGYLGDRAGGSGEAR